MNQELSGLNQKVRAKAKVRATPTMQDGVPEDKLHVTSRTHAVVVAAGTKRATTYAEAKVRMNAVGQEKVAESVRDSTEPGGVAALGHPQM